MKADFRIGRARLEWLGPMKADFRIGGARPRIPERNA
jgi:hypothetical protein